MAKVIVNENEEMEMMNGKVEPLNPAEDQKAEEKPKKPNVFKRAWNGIKSGLRKVKENPIATAIGFGVGTAATLGAKAYLDYRRSKIAGEDCGEAEPIETEDLGEEYVEEPEEPTEE